MFALLERTCLCWWVHSALLRALSLCRQILGSPAHRNEMRTHKSFGISRTRMPQCKCMDGPFRPHFAGAWVKGKRSFQNGLATPCFFPNFRRFQSWQVVCEISGFIFDRSHVNASHDVPTCKSYTWTKVQALCAANNRIRSTKEPANSNGKRGRFSADLLLDPHQVHA